MTKAAPVTHGTAHSQPGNAKSGSNEMKSVEKILVGILEKSIRNSFENSYKLIDYLPRLQSIKIE